MMKNGSVHFQIGQIAAALDANIKTYHAALNELKRISLLLFSEITLDPDLGKHIVNKTEESVAVQVS